MHIPLSFMRECWLLCNFRLACRGQGLHAPMPTFASLTRSGPLRKNELLHLLWCAKVRTCNSIHWTTRAPLISVWNYFTAAGYAFCQEEEKKKNLYECKTMWKWGHACVSWEHMTNCADATQHSPAKIERKICCLIPVILNKHAFLIPYLPFFEVFSLYSRAAAGLSSLHHFPPIIMQHWTNNSNQRRLHWPGYATLVCHSRLTCHPCRQGEICIHFSYLHMR